MELISTSAIWVSVSIVLINMLSDMFGILPISISKAAILLFSTSVAEAYLVIRNWSISAFISTDRSLVLSNSSSSFKIQRNVYDALSAHVQAHTFSPLALASFLMLPSSARIGFVLPKMERSFLLCPISFIERSGVGKAATIC